MRVNRMHPQRQDLRFGILGAGRIAADWASCFAYVAGGKITAVGSRSLPKGEAFAKQHGIGKSHGSYAALVRDPDVDVIYIATPLPLHREHVMLALEHNKAVLCEKPFATNSDDAEAMLRLAKSKNLFCMEAMWTNCIPAMRQIKGLIDQGTIGQIRLVTSDFGIDMTADPGHRIFDATLGGGSIIDLGIYPLALALNLCGDVSAVRAVGTIGASGVDECASVALLFANGAVASLTSAIVANTPLITHIYGSQGTIEIAGPMYSPKAYTLRRTASAGLDRPLLRRLGLDSRALKIIDKVARRLPDRLNPLVSRYKCDFSGKGYQFEINEVISCIRNGQTESNLVSHEATKNVYQVMDLVKQQIFNRS